MIKFFIKKVVVFVLAFLGVIALMHLIVGEYLNSRSSQEAIFIWGDSQTYFGIDLINLQESSQKRTNSAAFQGASVYDFLVFTKKIPANSNVMISISKLSQIQWKRHERNSSDFSFSSLIQLYKHNYSIKKLTKIGLKNKRPKNLYIKNSNSFLYPSKDSLVFALPIGHFEKYYQEIPNYLKDKQELFLEGIKTLKAKNSKITFIEFPYHPILQKIELESDIYPETEKFKMEIADLFEDIQFDTIRLDDNKNAMFDLSHLNHDGAVEVSKALANTMDNRVQAKMYIIHWRDIRE